MAEHLSSMHISSNYTAHNKIVFDTNPAESMSMDSDVNASSAFSDSVSQDLQSKLKNAQRITICEEIRKIKNEPLLPEALMERIERPCTALVLWQPPQFESTNKMASTDNNTTITDEDDLSNNNKNNTSMDLYSPSMDMDL